MPLSLPPIPAPFVGRQQEMQNLRRRLLGESAPLFLIGAAGLGKSALALAVAHDLQQRGYFGDGVLWLEGRELLSYSDMLNELARKVGSLGAVGHPLQQRERHILHQLDGLDSVVILDDLDALRDGRRSAIQFLRRLPVPVLITTRLYLTALDIPERLAALPVQHSYDLLCHLLEEPPPFEETESLLHHVGGVPLILRLLTPRLALGISVGQLIDELIHRPTGKLNLSQLGMTAASTKALLLAMRTLSEFQRTLLVAASYLSPSFTSACLAFVVGSSKESEVEAELQTLHQRGLVERGHERWHIHDLLVDVLRSFGMEQSEQWHLRAAGFLYRGTLSDQLQAANHLRHAGQVQRAALLLIRRGSAMVEAGLLRGLAEQLAHFTPGALGFELWIQVSEVQGDIARQQEQWWEATHYYEGVLQQIDSQPAAQRPQEVLARLLRKRAELALEGPPETSEEERLRQAEQWLRQAMQAVPAQSPAEQGRIALLQSQVYERRARLHDALHAAKQALAIARRAQLAALLDLSYEQIGVLYRRLGQIPIAMNAYRSALAVAQRLGNEQRQALLFTTLADLYQAEGLWAEAIEAYQASLPHWRQASLGGRLAQMLYRYGLLLLRRGQWERAQQAMQEAQIGARRAGLDEWVFIARGGMAEALLRHGEGKVAAAILEEALEQARQQMLFKPLPLLFRLRAEVALEQGDFVAAEDISNEALLWARRADDSLEGYRARMVHALARGDVVEIEELLEELLWPGLRYERARLQVRLAERLIQLDRARSIQLLEEAAAILERLGAAPDLAMLAHLRARHHLMQEDEAQDDV